jgi:phenylacetate-coenzyme A ligase PaaK-like adenylate-forming protein
MQALASQAGMLLISYPMPLWCAVVAAYRRAIALMPGAYVQVGGEVMTESVRRMLVRQLGVPIFQAYSATDYGSMAAECQHHHLHIVPGKTLVEIVDGEHQTQPGQWGEVVVTNFFSHGRPLVRVRTGDRAMWGEGRCPCGSPLPYIRYVAGRLEDQIVKSDGTLILWPDVENALHPYAEQVFGYQIEQVDPERITARLSVRESSAASGPLEDALGNLFEGMKVDILFTDDIRQAANGKTKSMIGIQNPTGSPVQLSNQP